VIVPKQARIPGKTASFPSEEKTADSTVQMLFFPRLDPGYEDQPECGYSGPGIIREDNEVPTVSRSLEGTHPDPTGTGLCAGFRRYFRDSFSRFVSSRRIIAISFLKIRDPSGHNPPQDPVSDPEIPVGNHIPEPGQPASIQPPGGRDLL
jgi:hypothetical protein